MPTWLPWPDSTCDGVRATQEGELLRLTLATPQTRNAQTPALWRRLAQVGEHLPADIRVVLIDAEGPSFSAGLDRRMFTATGVPGEHSVRDLVTAPATTADAWIAEFQSAFTWQQHCAAITIAAVQGHAIGAGFQLALACDLIIAADDAQFAMREVPLGLVPDLGGSQRLVEFVGSQRALLSCATGATIDADTAQQWGLASRCLPGLDLERTAQALIEQLLSTPANSLRAIKELMSRATSRSREDQLATERSLQLGLLRALAAAFVTEKTTPGSERNAPNSTPGAH
ncbi:MAG: enoyl-CoA hydratase/isomerase family protein [Actinomycetales bacterium]